MVGAILIFQAIWYKFFNESTIKNELERDGFAMFLYIYALVCVALLVTWSGSNRLWIIFVVIPGLTFLLTIIDVIVLAKNGISIISKICKQFRRCCCCNSGKVEDKSNYTPFRSVQDTSAQPPADNGEKADVFNKTIEQSYA